MAVSRRSPHAFLKLIVLVLVLGVAIGAGVFWLLAALWHSFWGEGPQFFPG
ncbi:hypothetical protein [Microbispora sp. H10670]|uniref:hypothetical protein n=1 Tax=Microbispora sp. H10670 TaxID=2729108 RepID=UPI00160451F3|nr:hypothetical protein [Microbispora sp. H10670]